MKRSRHVQSDTSRQKQTARSGGRSSVPSQVTTPPTGDGGTSSSNYHKTVASCACFSPGVVLVQLSHCQLEVPLSHPPLNGPEPVCEHTSCCPAEPNHSLPLSLLPLPPLHQRLREILTMKVCGLNHPSLPLSSLPLSSLLFSLFPLSLPSHLFTLFSTSSTMLVSFLSHS